MPTLCGLFATAKAYKFMNSPLVHVVWTTERIVYNSSICGMPTMDDMTCETMQPVEASPTCLWCIAEKAWL